MLVQLRRVVSLLLLPLFALQATGCTHVVKEPSTGPTPSADGELVGVTTLAGQEYKFDNVGFIQQDTVRGLVHQVAMSVPVDSVQRWWFRRSDPVATVGLVAVAVVGVVAMASALGSSDGPSSDTTVQSCPFVYVWNGTEFVFEAEPYGGAIAQGLERDDYSLVPGLTTDGRAYRLRMVNELQEAQMSNLAELWAIDHVPGVRVIPDEWGGLHTITGPVAPVSARTQSGDDLTRWVSSDDRLIWEPTPEVDSLGNLQDTITLVFPRPIGVTQAKLVTRVATSLWGSHMIRALLELRGDQLESWYDMIDATPQAADSVHAWALREGLYGLDVDVETRTGWTTAGVMTGSGPYLAETRVVPIDLSGSTGDSLRLRIRPTRGFWALNYLAVDYSDDQTVAVDTLRLQSASASSGVDIVPLLQAADTLYYAMPATGDQAELTFLAPPDRPGAARTLLLHTRGYYQLRLPPSTGGDAALVQRIETVPGATAEFSAQLYQQRVLAARADN
jgi:hypothetical protein